MITISKVYPRGKFTFDTQLQKAIRNLKIGEIALVHGAPWQRTRPTKANDFQSLVKLGNTTIEQVVNAYTADFDDKNMEWENVGKIQHVAIEGGQRFTVPEGILEVTYDGSLDGEITLNGNRTYTIDRGTIRESREDGE